MVIFFKQKTAYEMRISDWSSDLCSSDLEVFGLEKVGEETLESCSGVYLTDGVVNLALLKLNGTDFVGTHHFGFIVDDADAMGERIKDFGGEFFFSMAIGSASCRKRVCKSV